jgi:hypothetical protein
VLIHFSQSVIYHDSVEGNIYVSSDEGKSWRVPDDIPKGEAALVVEHPFDNSYVRFILASYSCHSYFTGIRSDA